jgi:hypothetical protein
MAFENVIHRFLLQGDLRHKEDKQQPMTEFVERQATSEARNYGLHLTTENGRKLQQLQSKFDANHRKKRASHELGFQ